MALTKLEFTTSPFQEDKVFGNAGAYEMLEGTAHFAIDPKFPLNQVITDIELAPVGDDGRVHCSADFAILRPQDPKRGNRRLLVEIPNRGWKTLQLLGWLSDPLHHGYTVAWCGWQHDVPDLSDRMRMNAPEAMEDGNPVTGPILCALLPDAPTHTMMLSHAGHRPYPAADIDEADATLSVRDHFTAPDEVIPRDRWRFARLDGDDVVPDPTHIYVSEGFEAGRHYDVVYTAIGAPLTGIGLAATRDFASFLRFEQQSSKENPCAGIVDFVHALGISQAGTVLRQLLYLGMCEDEEGRLAFDGLLSVISGGKRGASNWRFGQLSPVAPPGAGYLFPFTDALQTEPTTGETDGLQLRATSSGKAPKVMYFNSSAEYWVSQGSLIHTTLDGRDAIVPDNVRVYHVAGTQHVGTPLPLTNEREAALGDQKVVHPYNSLNYFPLLRAALVNLDRWVSHDEKPPPSRYPNLTDGTLVERESLRARFARIPGVSLPDNLVPFTYIDYGPDTASWRVTRLPPKIGPSYPDLVSDVDEDGNEVGGVRLPDVAVPLATYTGWNTRHPDMGGKGQALILTGATLVFPRTAEERKERGDPRLSIAERYASKDEYLAKVRESAEKLVAEGYMLEDDVEGVVEQSRERYDQFTA